MLLSGTIERERSCWGKIIDDGIIAHIMINITPVIAFNALLNMFNDFNKRSYIVLFTN